MGAVTKDFLLQKAAYPAEKIHTGIFSCVFAAQDVTEARANLVGLQADVTRALENIASVPDDIKLTN